MTHLISGVAAGLLIVGSVLNLTTVVRSPASDNALPWRAKWMAQARRHPLLRGAAVACLLAAAALFLVDIVVNHS
jgi:hypothetical protein